MKQSFLIDKNCLHPIVISETPMAQNLRRFYFTIHIGAQPEIHRTSMTTTGADNKDESKSLSSNTSGVATADALRKPVISFDQFESVEMRVGTIVHAEFFAEARKPAYKLRIDFGEQIGERQSSAQITQCYSVEELIGRQVVAVLNFEPRRIAGFKSEVLCLGLNNPEGHVVLLSPERPVSNGERVY